MSSGSSIVNLNSDQSGNTFVVGNFSGSMTIGEIQLVSKGASDFFVAKMNTSGHIEWAHGGGGPGNDSMGQCELDAQGNVYFTGHFSDSLQVGGKEFAASGDRNLFIAKVDGSGNVLWAVRAGSPLTTTGLAVDPNGDGYIIGLYNDTAVIGADTLSAFLSTGTFAARFDQGGNILWSDGATCVTDIGWKSLGIDQSGDAVITGFVDFSAVFDSFSVTAPHGWYDVITVKYQSNGKMSWAKTAGGSSFDQPAALRIDSNGGAVIVGAYGAPFIPGGINFDSYFLPQVGEPDIFVARYNSNGDVAWARSAGGVGYDRALNLALDSTDNIYWAGTYQGEAYVSDFRIDPTDSDGIFLSRLFDDGEAAWVKAVPGAKNVTINDMVYLPKGQILVTGKFSDDFVVDTDTLKAQGADNAFVLRFQEVPYTISVDTAVAFSGDTIDVPVRVSFFPRYAVNETNVEFVLLPQQGTLIGVGVEGSVIAGKNWQVEMATRGDTTALRLSGVDEVTSGGLFFYLRIATAPTFYGFVNLRLNEVLINGGVEKVRTTPGGIVVNVRRGSGDVDFNQMANAEDAALLLDYLVGDAELDSLAKIRADVTLNEDVTALDAALIHQFTRGTVGSLPVDTTVFNPGTAGKFNLADQEIETGQPVEIPLRIENAVDVHSYEISLSFDRKFLEFEDFALLPDTLGMFRASGDSLGKLRIVVANAAPVQGNEVLAALRFSIKGDLPKAGTTVRLDLFRLNEDEFSQDTTAATISIITGVEENDSRLPERFSLSQNYPNPFNPTTTIEYAVPQPTHVSLAVYNTSGQLVQTLVDGFRQPGTYKAEWNAGQIGAGLYFYKFSAGEFASVKKAVVLK